MPPVEEGSICCWANDGWVNLACSFALAEVPGLLAVWCEVMRFRVCGGRVVAMEPLLCTQLTEGL